MVRREYEYRKKTGARKADEGYGDRFVTFAIYATIAVAVLLGIGLGVWRARAVEARAETEIVRGELRRSSITLAKEYERTSELKTQLGSAVMCLSWQAKAARSLEASAAAIEERLEEKVETPKATVTPSSTTSTKPHVTVTKRRTIPATRPGGVTRWKPLVQTYFKTHSDDALTVMTGESGGNPNAKNGPCWGLFQIDHEIHAKKIAEKAKAWDMKPDLFDPEFNIRFAAYMTNYGTNWSNWTVQP